VFRRVDGQLDGELRVVIPDGAAPATAPELVHVIDARLGYELEVRTLERHPL